MELINKYGTIRRFPAIYAEQDLVEFYQESESGHFFDQDAMRFFKSRLTSHFRKLDDCTFLFVTTEANFRNTRRAATVRKAQIIPDVNTFQGYRITIDIVSEFNTLSISQAKTFLKNYLK